MIKLINFAQPINYFYNTSKTQTTALNQPTQDSFVKSKSVSFAGDDFGSDKFDMEEFDELMNFAQNIELDAAKAAEPHYRKAYDELVEGIVNDKPLNSKYALDQTAIFSMLNDCTSALCDSLALIDKGDEAIKLAQNTIDIINKHYTVEVDEDIYNKAFETLNTYKEKLAPESINPSKSPQKIEEDDADDDLTFGEEPSFEVETPETTEFDDNPEQKLKDKNARYQKAVNVKLPNVERFKEIEALEKDGEYAVLHHIALSNTDELSNKFAIISLGYHKKDEEAKKLLASIAHFHSDEKYRNQAKAYLG